MGREIKFRAWIPRDKIMVDVLAINFKDKHFDYWHPEHGAARNSIDDENGIIMQYTGLKDKNGKEIYEGDIVKADFNVFTIKYFTRLTWDDGCPHPGFYFEQNGSEMSYHDNFEDIEVIGNQRENPELLSDKK